MILVFVTVVVLAVYAWKYRKEGKELAQNFVAKVRSLFDL